ncbi:MAG: hypothetical protein AAF203_05800 [Pseudomonadota bacterium]
MRILCTFIGLFILMPNVAASSGSVCATDPNNSWCLSISDTAQICEVTFNGSSSGSSWANFSCDGEQVVPNMVYFASRNDFEVLVSGALNIFKGKGLSVVSCSSYRLESSQRQKVCTLIRK